MGCSTSIIGSVLIWGTSACGGTGDGTVGPPPAAVDASEQPSVVPTAFRMSDLDLREPHIFLGLAGCADVTDTPFLGVSINGALQKAIQTDANGDGLLDFNALVVFRPVDTSRSTVASELRFADCTSPMTSTSCTAAPSAQVLSSTASNVSIDTCLGPLSGTTFAPYSPEIPAPTGPCFVSELMTLELNLGGLPIRLRDVNLAAEYTGTPTDRLTSGLIRGFLNESDANAMLPSPINAPLSSLLPGGTGSCATHDDRDVNSGITGWYFYLEFSAAQVPYVDHAE